MIESYIMQNNNISSKSTQANPLFFVCVVLGPHLLE